jgi:hypothetical protein
MICRRCWRRAPKALRDNFSRFERRLTIARKRGSDLIALLEHVRDIAFRRVHASLIDKPADNDMPALLREQLRKDGLL